MRVVPRYENCGRERSTQLFSRNPEFFPQGCAGRKNHGIVLLLQLGNGEIAPNFHIRKQSEVFIGGDLLEDLRDGLDLLMIGRHTTAYQTPRSWQTFDHVDVK